MWEDELKNNSLGILQSNARANILSIYHIIRNEKQKFSDIRYWNNISESI